MGNQAEHPIGFDRHVPVDMLNNPFLPMFSPPATSGCGERVSLALANFHIAEVDRVSSDGELEHVLRHGLHFALQPKNSLLIQPIGIGDDDCMTSPCVTRSSAPGGHWVRRPCGSDESHAMPSSEVSHGRLKLSETSERRVYSLAEVAMSTWSST